MSGRRRAPLFPGAFDLIMMMLAVLGLPLAIILPLIIR